MYAMNENELFDAAWDNDVTAIRRAIANGADPNKQHPRAGTLPLQLACQNDATDAIKELLDAGARADAVFTRVSRVDERLFADHVPLMYVQSVAAAKLLIDAGAKLESHDARGWTALVYAIFGGKEELTSYLLECGASLEVRPLLDGKEMTLPEFLDDAIAFIEHNAPPEKAEAQTHLARMKTVRDLVKCHKRA